MNWRVSSLDRYQLVSNSDAHSPPALGREATVLSCELDYSAVREALETGDGLDGTIEFFPEEGKYHARRAPALRGAAGARARPGPPDGRCPVCGKPLTVGVLHRVEELADRPAGYLPAGRAAAGAPGPAAEILGEINGVGAKVEDGRGRGRRGWSPRSGRSWRSCRTCRWTRSAAVGPRRLGEALAPAAAAARSCWPAGTTASTA